MTVADRIRLRREELNLSQEELAKKIGNKDKSTISKIEKSGDDITMKNIQRIAIALGVSSQYLLGWEETLEDLRKKILELQFDLFQSDDNESSTEEKQMKLNDTTNRYLQLLEKSNKVSSENESNSIGQIEKALDFMSRYEKASPEIQEAIQTLLKVHQ